MKKFSLLYLLCWLVSMGNVLASPPHSYEMAGEVSESSIILQTRLHDKGGKGNWEACFELSETPDFKQSFATEWQEALAEHDFIVKQKIFELSPATRYHYRAIWRSSTYEIKGQTQSFGTLPGPLLNGDVSFIVIADMNYAYFHNGREGLGISAYRGRDKHLGYPALQAIAKLDPNFLISIGDSVYYDHPIFSIAKTKDQMRLKWQEQLNQERFLKLFSHVPAYWQMDDHDYRFNDAYPAAAGEPSHELGINVFIEQVPVLGWEDPVRLYRTHRVNRVLQIWILDGRTLRSPNVMPDGLEKSIWGKEQTDWLKHSLLESDAPFKIIVSSTPIIGPVRAGTRDSHTDPSGFYHERQEFLRWLVENGFSKQKIYFIAGDNHWKNHSQDPLGFSEFTCGSLDDTNARKGVPSGHEKSTDPGAEIKQFYVDPKPLGGFLQVTVREDVRKNSAGVEFSFYNSKGRRIYSI